MASVRMNLYHGKWGRSCNKFQITRYWLLDTGSWILVSGDKEAQSSRLKAECESCGCLRLEVKVNTDIVIRFRKMVVDP